MICKNCGAKVKKNKFFCDECGESVGNIGELDSYNKARRKKQRQILPFIAVLIVAICSIIIYKAEDIMPAFNSSTTTPYPLSTPTLASDNIYISSDIPTAEPVIIPTTEPTIAPTAEPTTAPTAKPILTDNTYLYPSDTTLFSDDFLNSLDDYSARLARNELYARYGLVFKTKSLQNYFSKKSWYVPNHEITPNQIINKFNEIELKNHSLIINYELSKNPQPSPTIAIEPLTPSEQSSQTENPISEAPLDAQAEILEENN